MTFIFNIQIIVFVMFYFILIRITKCRSCSLRWKL